LAAAGRGLSLFLSGCHLSESFQNAFFISFVSAPFSISKISNGSKLYIVSNFDVC